MAKKKSPIRSRTSEVPWTIKPASSAALKQWEDAHASEPELMTGERERLALRPLHRGDNPRRTYQLRGPLATKRVGGVALPQWQHKISGAGRIWYCVDKEVRIIWVTKVDLSHPRETE